MSRHILSRFWKNTKGRPRRGYYLNSSPNKTHQQQKWSLNVFDISSPPPPNLWMINEKEFGIVETLDGNEEGDSSCNRERLTQWTDLSPFDTLDHYTEERVLLRKNTKSLALKVMICLSPLLLLHEAIVCWCCGADILVTISLVPTASLHAKILCNTHRNVRGTLLDHKYCWQASYLCK